GLAIPVDPLKPEGQPPLFWEPLGSGTLLPLEPGNRVEHKYRQVTLPLREPDLAPFPVQVSPKYVNQFRTKSDLPLQGWTALRAWTDELLRRLAAERAYELVAEDLATTDDKLEGEGVAQPRLPR